MDHFLEDCGEVVADLGSQGWREGGPDGGGRIRHKTSYCSTRVTSSATAVKVSLVRMAGQGSARLVAAVASRKVMDWR
jgi:hypothetical protein